MWSWVAAWKMASHMIVFGNALYPNGTRYIMVSPDVIIAMTPSSRALSFLQENCKSGPNGPLDFYFS